MSKLQVEDVKVLLKKKGPVSSKKVVEVAAVESKKKMIEGYRLMDMSILHKLISLLLIPNVKIQVST